MAYKKDEEVRFLGLGSLIVILALIWNFETGLVSLLTWFAFRFYKTLQQQVSLRNAITNFIIEIALSLVLLIAGWIVISCCNLLYLNGDIISFRQYLFPFGEKGNEFLKIIMINYQKPIMLWMIMVILCFTTLSYCVSKTVINHNFKKAFIKDDDAIVFALTTVTLSKMTLYINRQVLGNLYIAYPSAVILLCLVLRWIIFRHQEEQLKNIKLFLYGIMNIRFIAMLSVVLAGIANYGISEQARIDEGTRDMKSVYEIEEAIVKAVPKNTKFWGAGSSVIYWDLRRDGGYHFLDTSDLGARPHLITKILDGLNNHLNEGVLIDGFSLEEVRKFGQLDLFENRFRKKIVGISFIVSFVVKKIIRNLSLLSPD